MRTLSFALLSFLLVGSTPAPAAPAPAVAAQAAPAQAAPARAKAAQLPVRVTVAGASLSAGYGLGSDPLQPETTLAAVVAASFKREVGELRDLSSLMVFMSPRDYLVETLDTLVATPPDALIALDLLFWCGYGMGDEPQRVERLELALAGLAKLECRILLGDLPDMSAAAAVEPSMLPAMMHPAPDLRERLNTRIRAWAAERKQVVVVPLGRLVASLEGGEAIELRGNRWKQGAALLQADRLHPTLEGLIAVWIAAADAWISADPSLPVKRLELDAQRLATALDRARAAPAKPARPVKPAKPLRPGTR